MNYRHISKDAMTDFSNNFPEMSLGEIMYSILREVNTGKKIGSISELLEIDDKSMYLAIEKAVRDERE